METKLDSITMADEQTVPDLSHRVLADARAHGANGRTPYGVRLRPQSARDAARQRERIDHKFRIYPEKSGEIRCAGCCNRTRNCPAGRSVSKVLEDC